MAVIARHVFLTYGPRLHSTKVMSPMDVTRILQLASKIRTNGSTRFPKVFACANDHWKPLVSMMINAVDAIFIDLSEVTANMQWEVLTALSNKPGRNIVILVKTDDDPEWSRDKLAAVLFRKDVEPKILDNFRDVKIVRYKGLIGAGGNASGSDARGTNRAITAAISNALDEAISR